MYSSSVLLDSTLDYRANHEATTFLLLFVYTVLCTYILVKFVHDFAKFEHGNALVHQTGLVHCPKNSLNLSRKTEPVADEADATVYSTLYSWLYLLVVHIFGPQTKHIILMLHLL